MKAFTTFIIAYSKPKFIFILFGIFILFNVLFFPLLATNGTHPLDLGFFYSADFVYQTLDAYSDFGRMKYLISESTIDIAYPIVYSAFLSLCSYFFFQNIQLARLPILILVFDWIENAIIILLLLNYPNQIESLAGVVGIFSGIKWIFALINVVLLLIGLVLYFIQKRK